MIGMNIELGLSLIAIPWLVWVTVSIFNQRQEIALVKQTHDDMSRMMKVLIEVFGKKTNTDP